MSLDFMCESMKLTLYFEGAKWNFFNSHFLPFSLLLLIISNVLLDYWLIDGRTGEENHCGAFNFSDNCRSWKGRRERESGDWFVSPLPVPMKLSIVVITWSPVLFCSSVRSWLSAARSRIYLPAPIWLDMLLGDNRSGLQLQVSRHSQVKNELLCAQWCVGNRSQSLFSFSGEGVSRVKYIYLRYSCAGQWEALTWSDGMEEV